MQFTLRQRRDALIHCANNLEGHGWSLSVSFLKEISTFGSFLDSQTGLRFSRGLICCFTIIYVLHSQLSFYVLPLAVSQFSSLLVAFVSGLDLRIFKKILFCQHRLNTYCVLGVTKDELDSLSLRN